LLAYFPLFNIWAAYIKMSNVPIAYNNDFFKNFFENFEDNNLKLSNEAERKVEVSADRDTDEGVDNKAAEFSEVKLLVQISK